MSIRTRSGLALCCLCVLACSGDRDAQICSTSAEGLRVRYFGQAYGYGSIQVFPSEDEGTLDVKAQMMGPDSNAEILLAGQGSCDGGVLRARLGGGLDEESGIRVLGGSLVVLFEHAPMPEVTGFWEVRAIMPESTDEDVQEYRFRGMLERVDPTAASDAPGRGAQDVDGQPPPS